MNDSLLPDWGQVAEGFLPVVLGSMLGVLGAGESWWLSLAIVALAGSAWCFVWLHDSFQSEFEWSDE